MRIAMLISSLQKGGSERVIVNLAAYFQQKGHQVTIVTQYQAEKEYPVPPGVKRIFSEITDKEAGRGRISNFYRRFMKLRRIWKEQRPEIVLSFIGKNNLMTILTSRFLSIPVVVSVRGEPKLEYDSFALRTLACLLFGFAEGVVLQTRRCEEFFPSYITKRAKILMNPLDPAFLRPLIPFLPREKWIVAVGRVDVNKNHGMLIDVFAELAQEFPEYRLIVYGEGELRADLLQKVIDLGMEDKIFLPGAVANVEEKIAAASVYVLTSYSEGMPNTLMEAMALGIVPVASDCPSGGPAELIRQGENGFLFPPGDHCMLRNQLRELLKQPELAGKLSSEAAQIRQTCSPDVVNRQWEEYLLSVAEQYQN